MERLRIPHVPYTILWSGGYPYSVCEDFVSPDTELISVQRIMQTKKKDNGTSTYQHFVSCCQSLGITNIVSALDRMLVLDYLIANEDRHFNNLGLLRHPETLTWLGMAPIFDSGSSFGYDRTAARIRTGQDILCKPFKKRHEQQLMLISSFHWIDFSALADTDTLIRNALSALQAAGFTDADRVDAIAETAQRRVQILWETAKAWPASC